MGYETDIPTSYTQLYSEQAIKINQERTDNAKSLAIAVFNYAESQGSRELARFYIKNRQLINDLPNTGLGEYGRDVLRFSFADIKDIISASVEYGYKTDCLFKFLSLSTTPSPAEIDKCVLVY